MRRKGNHCEHISDRDRAILAHFRRLARSSPTIDLSEISANIAPLPAPRFWVSEERAFVILSDFEHGRPLPSNMRPTKRRMFVEILRRFLLLSRKPLPSQHCAEGASPKLKSRRQIISEIVNSPAPEFFMEPKYVEDIIRRRRRKIGR